MSQIAERTPMDQVVAGIEHPRFVEQVQQSLPEGVSLDRFKRVTITAVKANPELITADRNTLFASIVRCAQDGLLPDGREAAFVMFGKDVVYMPMIGGFRKIAAEHGWAIDTQVVYRADEFKYTGGVDFEIVHVPAPLDVEPGDPIGAYAVATHEDGRKLVEVMRKSEIEKVRAVSRAKNGGPWKDWTERMWEKTVGRRIFGKLPLSGRALDRAASVMRAHDRDYELPTQAPKMTTDEANIAAPFTNLAVPSGDGPNDEPPLEGDYEA